MQLKHVSYHILKQTGDNFLQVKLKGFCLLSENHVRGEELPQWTPIISSHISCTILAQPSNPHAQSYSVCMKYQLGSCIVSHNCKPSNPHAQSYSVCVKYQLAGCMVSHNSNVLIF